MGERLTGKFDQQQVDGFEAMQEAGEADSYSEAVRRASAVGLQQMGYTNGKQTNTTLRKATQEASKLFLYFGLAIMGITWFYPLELRVMAVGPIVSGLFLVGVDRVLATHEPNISNKLRSLFGGEPA